MAVFERIDDDTVAVYFHRGVFFPQKRIGTLTAEKDGTVKWGKNVYKDMKTAMREIAITTMAVYY